MDTLPEPVGFRTRYRSEPGMIGHYPWTYADQSRRRADRPQHESEDLYTAEQLKAAVLAEREACAALCDTRSADHWHDYKTGPMGVKGSARSEHRNDEAEACAAAIRARGE